MDALSAAAWQALGSARAGAAPGAPAWHPARLVSGWRAGVMPGLRSARTVAGARREQRAWRWLTDNQPPTTCGPSRQVQCFAYPCFNKTAVCDPATHTCTTAPITP